MEHWNEQCEVALIWELHRELNPQKEMRDERRLINDVEFLLPLPPFRGESFMSRTSLLNRRYVKITIPLKWNCLIDNIMKGLLQAGNHSHHVVGRYLTVHMR
jgi:hypothetical protein